MRALLADKFCGSHPLPPALQILYAALDAVNTLANDPEFAMAMAATPGRLEFLVGLLSFQLTDLPDRCGFSVGRGKSLLARSPLLTLGCVHLFLFVWECSICDE